MRIVAVVRRPVVCLVAVLALGCANPPDEPEHLWGVRGVRDGMFVRPRAAAIGPEDRLFLVDFTARIQVFDLDGRYLGPTWTTPDYRIGRPSDLAFSREGHLIVCDSHYHCVRIYSLTGELLQTIGGRAGREPGEFGYISAAVQDQDGFYYVAEFDFCERITKLDNKGEVVKTWGTAGSQPGEFQRIRGLALGPDGLLYVADTMNHRIQVFTREGEWVRSFGEFGSGPGQLKYPYKLAFGPRGDLYVVEYENHRVQKFTPEGRSLATWGRPGRRPGELHSPWCVVVDRRGRVHVIDTENHRVQRVKF